MSKITKVTRSPRSTRSSWSPSQLAARTYCRIMRPPGWDADGTASTAWTSGGPFNQWGPAWASQRGQPAGPAGDISRRHRQAGPVQAGLHWQSTIVPLSSSLYSTCRSECPHVIVWILRRGPQSALAWQEFMTWFYNMTSDCNFTTWLRDVTSRDFMSRRKIWLQLTWLRGRIFYCDFLMRLQTCSTSGSEFNGSWPRLDTSWLIIHKYTNTQELFNLEISFWLSKAASFPSITILKFNCVFKQSNIIK